MIPAGLTLALTLISFAVLLNTLVLLHIAARLCHLASMRRQSTTQGAPWTRRAALANR